MRLRSVKPASVLSLGAILLVLIVGIAYMSLGVLKINPFKDFTTAIMLLADSGGIGNDSPVLLTGIEVGKVTAVKKIATGVEVDLRIDNTYKIPANSAIRIENLSALGEPYVEFAPSSNDGPYIQNNQVLDTRNIQAPMSIPQVAVRVVELLHQFDPKAVSSLVDTADKALTGTESEVPRLERSTKLLAATILSRTEPFRQLLTDLQTLGADMDWAGPGLRDSGPQFAEFGTHLEDIINIAARLFEVGDSPTMYQTGDGLVPFLKNATALLNKIGPSLADLVPILQPLADDAARVGSQLDISSLIAQAVNTVGDDGALHLQIAIK